MQTTVLTRTTQLCQRQPCIVDPCSPTFIRKILGHVPLPNAETVYVHSSACCTHVSLCQDWSTALNRSHGNVFLAAVGGGCCTRRCPIDGRVRGDLCQPMLLAVCAAAGTELAGGAGRVAARQKTANADSPKEPAGRPAAPAQHHAAGHHAQEDVEDQQGQGGRGLCREQGGDSLNSHPLH